MLGILLVFAIWAGALGAGVYWWSQRDEQELAGSYIPLVDIDGDGVPETPANQLIDTNGDGVARHAGVGRRRRGGRRRGGGAAGRRPRRADENGDRRHA